MGYQVFNNAFLSNVSLCLSNSYLHVTDDVQTSLSYVQSRQPLETGGLNPVHASETLA